MLAALVALAVASPARADQRPRVDSTTHLDVITALDAPAECPSREALEARVTALVRSPSASVTSRVQIVPVESGLEARVEISESGSSALRTLHARDCDALASAVALVIAMVIDPSAALRMRPTEAGPTESAPAEPAPTEPAPPEPSIEAPTDPPVEAPTDPPIEATHAPIDAPRTDEPDEPMPPPVAPPPPVRSAAPPPTTPSEQPPLDVSFVADALFVVGAGVLPLPSWGALLLGGVRIEGFEIALGALVLAESRASLTSTRGGDFGLLEGRLRLGYAVDLSPVELVPTLALDVGATWGRGFGVARPGSGTALSLDVAAGLEARLHLLPELSIAVFAELVVPALRPEFVLTGIATTPVFRASEVGTFFGLGLATRLR